MIQNMVGWFEVPVIDMERAVAFYNKVFNLDLQVMSFGNELMAWFPFDESKPGASGTLIKADAYEPRDNGTLVYFASEDVNIELGKVESAGGKLLQAKTQISPDIGYMGLFLDSEGNRIALHSRA